ncbi:MAG TPA: RHS repeat-associated core domain-containing protein [Pyrinomonadaceae bacterium]|nr:RHS repeat-associated core domain-containing protein [Pyrinomonadaceae bacterium]
MVESIAYDAFGNGGGSLTRYTYTGREYDGRADLYYYRARWYDPDSGRFTSEDPIGLSGGINLYTYVENKPLKFVDPQGTSPVGLAIVAGVIVGEFGIHYYLSNRAYGLFPDDELGRKKHCYVNCMSVRIHLGGRTMATIFSVAQESTLVQGTFDGHFRREARDTAGDLAADGFGQFASYAIWRSCKDLCDQCPSF